MKPLDELDHYEVLEVPPGAGFEEIERAYRMTREAYTDDSMALYSVFNHDDAVVIRNRIDEAYRILADPKVRAKYDAEAGISSQLGDAQPPDPAVDTPAVDSRSGGAGRGSAAPAELSSAIEVIDDLGAEIEEESHDLNGAALRRARLRRGVELDQISDVTKVSVSYLSFIEDEDFERLPASVYIRGFVHAYARAIGLDADRVATNYMVRVEAVRNPPRRLLRPSSP